MSFDVIIIPELLPPSEDAVLQAESRTLDFHIHEGSRAFCQAKISAGSKNLRELGFQQLQSMSPHLPNAFEQRAFHRKCLKTL